MQVGLVKLWGEHVGSWQMAATDLYVLQCDGTTRTTLAKEGCSDDQGLVSVLFKERAEYEAF